VHDSITIDCIQNRPVSVTYTSFVCFEDMNLNKLHVTGKGVMAGIIDGSNARSVQQIS
jgi:hypothetical protein